MKKRFFSLLLCLCMALALCPVTAFAEEPNADATELQNLLNADGTVTLQRDYTINTTLQVGEYVTLDLNGHVIRMTGSGSVFKVYGTGCRLTLQDSDPTAEHTDDPDLPAGGVITGANLADRGGGVDVSGGRFTMEGGTIYNCCAEASGGGVYVMDGFFTMSGGAIRDCSTNHGGGVAVITSTFTISGGVIEGCSAQDDGDAVFATNDSHIVANGGAIKGAVDSSADIKNTSDEGGTLFYGPIARMGNIINNGRTVTFHTGTDFYALEVVADGKQAVAPEAPTKGDGTFTGWYTDEALTTPYDFDSSVTENITLYAGFTSAPYTVTASFSVTVETFDRGEPGETTFELETVNGQGEPVEFDGVKVTASVTTDGAGTYPSTMSINGSMEDLRDMLIEGVYVRQVDEGKANWNYDDGVWALFLKEGIVALDADDDAAPAYSILIFPTILEETENGEYYKIDWNGGPVKEMSFINTYASNQAHIRAEDLSDEDESTKPAGGNSSSGDKSNPQTGDGNGLALCTALIAVSAAGMAAARLSGKRGKNGRAK